MLFPSYKELIENVQMLLGASGRAGLCQQLLDYVHYGMVKIAKIIGREAQLEPNHKYYGVERFETEYRRLVVANLFEEVIKAREKQRPSSFESIQPLLRQTVKLPYPQFTAYDAPEEVFDYFQQQGQYHLLRLQEHENFGPEDVFGGLPYRTYVDAVEHLMGVALMHTHYALAAIEKQPQALLANLLPYLRPDHSFVEALVKDLDVTEEQASQILSCLTVDKTNCEGYTSFTAAAPPPFVRMSDGFLLRSVAGCCDNPFQLLNYELKRRFEKDYFRAVNNREDRFRSDLFKLFPQEHIIKLDREVRITTPLGATDIDAVMYDRKTCTLALIQLKWPDAYGDSMRRRASVVTNYYSKANEWVEKVYAWATRLKTEEIFSALQLQLTREERRSYKGFYLMVLNRHTAHFTSGEPSEKAAWGSWMQLIATLATGLKYKPDDPLGAAYSCLRYFDPKRRTDRGDVPDSHPFEIKIGDSKVSMKF